MPHIGLGHFLHGITPTAMYLAMWVAAILGLAWKPSAPLYVLIPMLPLETIRAKVIPMPLGSHFIEILLFASLLGIWLHSPAPRLLKNPLNRVIIALVVVTFLCLVLGSFYLGMPLAFSNADPRFAAWFDYMLMPLTFVAVLGAIRTRREITILMVLMMLSAAWVARDANANIGQHSQAVFNENSRNAGPLGFAGANGTAVFLAQIEALALGALLFCKKWRMRIAWAALFGIGMYGLVYSYSREAYLGFLAAVVFLGVTRKRILLVGVVALLLAWRVVLPASVQQRIEMTYSGDAAAGSYVQPGGGKELDASSAERIALWKDALAMWTHEPVFGAGFETFAFVPHLDGLRDTHNYYVKALAETGTIGFVVFVWILATMYWLGWRLAKLSEEPFWSGFGLAFAASVVCVTVANFFGDRWTYFQVDAFLWTLAAIAVRGWWLARAARSGPVAGEVLETAAGGQLAPTASGAVWR